MTQPTLIRYMPPSELQEHPEASRIPEMLPDEWADFNESVRTRGVVTDPVFALPDGRVFDGRHRLRSAQENSLPELPVITWEISDDEALQRMSESAVLRRSLLPGQRAAIVLEFTELVERLREEAKERQQGGVRVDSDLTPGLGQGVRGRSATAKELANKSGIGKSNMEYLMAVQRDEPDLFEKVKTGEITINKAYTEKKRRAGVISDNIDSPKRSHQSPVREKLTAIKKTADESKHMGALPEESSFSPANILRHHSDNVLLRVMSGMCADHEALSEGADAETVTKYLDRVKLLIHGFVLIVSDFDENPVIRELYGQIAYLVEGSRSNEGLAAITQTITKGGNNNE